MSPPNRNYPVHQDQQLQNLPTQYSSSNSVPSTPIPLYPTGAAALIPAPPTYEVIPNRIFVGGFPTTTVETELRDHFETFYPVKDVKMVKSLDGASKGYGFITFETEDQAEAIRQLTPKQLEFRGRKLNLGPAIRKINATAFPPGSGYAITAPGSLVSNSPSPFGYYSASPSPYNYQISPAPMFVYPPITANPEAAADQRTPQLSPTQQPQQQSPQQQMFFGDQQEPVRTYASAVSGVVKSESVDDRRSLSPQQQQPLGQHNMQFPPLQWQPNNEGDNNNNNNNTSAIYPVFYNENLGGYMHPQQYQPHQQQQYQQNGGDGDKPGFGVPMYMNNNGMVHYYMPPPVLPTGQYPQLMRAPYWNPQLHNQQQHQKSSYANGYYGNNWVGGQDMQQQMAQQMAQAQWYYQGYPGYQQPPQQVGNEENSYVRPLQPPRAGKKNRKASESQEKKNKSPSKGNKTSSPEKTPKKWPSASSSTGSPLSTSLQSLAISSPTKNN